MEKEEFLNELKNVLTSRGLDGEALADKLAQGEAYLDKYGIGDSDFTPELLADGLTAEPAADAAPEEAGTPAQAEETSEAATEAAADGAEENAPAEGNAASEEPVKEAEKPVNLDEYSPTKKKKKEKKAKKEKKEKNEKKEKVKKEKEAPAAENLPAKESYDFDGSENSNGIGGKILFWTTLLIALPFIIFLALLSLIIYVGIWIVLALMMIACITVLIAFVGGGVAISFVGIVYGALQIVKGNLPVGLFEIGLGIVVGSVVMLVSIIIYNVAVRLIPFVMKQLTKLLSAAYRGGAVAVEAVKGACERA